MRSSVARVEPRLALRTIHQQATATSHQRSAEEKKTSTPRSRMWGTDDLRGSAEMTRFHLNRIEIQGVVVLSHVMVVREQEFQTDFANNSPRSLDNNHTYPYRTSTGVRRASHRVTCKKNTHVIPSNISNMPSPHLFHLLDLRSHTLVKMFRSA